MSRFKLKRTAGRIKYKVLDCWPYKFKEKRAAKLRAQLRPRAFELPIIPTPHSPEVEIHMLCGKGQLDMGLWASWSILRFLKRAVLYVHSDGTLGYDDVTLWQKIVPNMVLVTKAEADGRTRHVIASAMPSLYSRRCTGWCGAQLVDMHMFGELDRLIVMDSDVLCFRNPLELRASLSVEKPVYRWNRDVRSCYSESINVLSSVTGLRVPEALNAGFLLTPRFGREDFEYLEHMINLLKADGRINTNHIWSTQTYYAMCAARCPKSHPLPDGYAVTLGRTSDDAVVRHYVGVPRVRPRYFTEGVPKLLRDL